MPSRRAFLGWASFVVGGLLVVPDPGNCPPRNPHCASVPTTTTTTLPPSDDGMWSDMWSDTWS